MNNYHLFRNIIIISVYFLFSISLTFYHRWLLQKIPYSISVTVVDLIIGFVIAIFVKWLKNSSYQISNLISCLKIIGFIGVASGLDIACSNWGLRLVTITLYTLTKTTTIVFILLFAIILKLEQKSLTLFCTIGCIAVGLFLFTYKSTQFNVIGFVALLCASMFSGFRWSFMQLLLQKHQITAGYGPLDMIVFMHPFMIITTIILAAIVEQCNFLLLIFPGLHRPIEWHFLRLVLYSGILAFFLTISEYVVVENTSSLTLSIAGIFKEIIIILLAVEFNGDEVTILNSLGLIICLLGIVSHVLHKMRQNDASGITISTIPNETINLNDNIPLLNSQDEN